MKISDIAKKLGVSIKEVRDKARELNFSIAQKSNTMSDKKAKEFIEAIQKNLISGEAIADGGEKEAKMKQVPNISLLLPSCFPGFLIGSLSALVQNQEWRSARRRNWNSW